MDYKKLISDVVDAQAAENHRQQVNDAKFRAVEQRVQSYNEFASIVKGCHLRPLDKKESLGTLTRTTVPAWNAMVTKSGGGGSSSLDLEVSKYFNTALKDACSTQVQTANQTNSDQ